MRELALGGLIAIAFGMGSYYATDHFGAFNYANVILGALALAYNALVLRDPLYWPYIAREAAEVLLARPEEIRKALVLTAAFVVLPIIAFIVMTRRDGRTMAFVILAAAAGPALNFWHVRADYEHRYNYGERGLTEAAAALEAVPSDKAQAKKVVVIGTVEADLHSVGKNIVAMMLKSGGFELHDVRENYVPAP